jgi:hypothetical protein
MTTEQRRAYKKEWERRRRASMSLEERRAVYVRVKESQERRNFRVSPEREIYDSARQRCTNPNSQNWKNYGGRGIRFLFTSFEQFFAELGPRPAGMSLDRKNNDGNYEPGNVRWATASEQRRNQRRAA